MRTVTLLVVGLMGFGLAPAAAAPTPPTTVAAPTVVAAPPLHAGDADPTWGSGGTATVATGSISTAAALPDGGLLVATPTGVTELGPTGKVDPSYGSAGTAPIPGVTWIGAGASGDAYVVTTAGVTHLLPTGQPDPAFGAAGLVATPSPILFAAVDDQDRLLYEVGQPPTIERLTVSGAADPTFAGGAAAPLPEGQAGPIVVTGDGGATVVETDVPVCEGPVACAAVVELALVSPTGAVTSGGGAPGLPDGSPPAAAAYEPNGELHVVGADSEELIRPDDTLDPSFGQGACGDPIGTPTAAGGTLSLLADGRTADLSSIDHGTYDIVPHIFVRADGRRDLTFGAGGEASLNEIDEADFLTSTPSAMWIALDVGGPGETPSIVKILLTPAVPTILRGAPEDFGQRAVTTTGDVLQLPPYYGTTPAPCGSLVGTPLAQPIVGGAGSPDGVGYWLVARDGGVFSFGDARFHGSTGAIRLNQPVVGMAATPDGGGYWLVAADGGIFSFGDAVFHGSAGGIRLAAPVVGMLSTPSGNGYLLAARDGGVFTFGDAGYGGNGRASPPTVAITASPPGTYALALADGTEVNVSYGVAQPLGAPALVVGMFPD